MVKEVDNFLSQEECQHLISIIDKNHTRSTVAGGGTEQSVYNETRTSSTCNLPNSDEIVFRIKKKISAYLGIELNKGEDIQGQLYEPGQYFHPHHDYFDGNTYINHCLASGNRTDTFMVFLNEDLEGGYTNFPHHNLSIKPATGKAVTWNSMIGEEYQGTSLHEGQTVTKGKKYIITSWWRESIWQPAEDARRAKSYHSAISSKQNIKTKTFSSQVNFPKFTTSGFKVMKCPSEVWNMVLDSYELLKESKVKEEWPGMEEFIKGGDNPVDILSFEKLPSIKSMIHNQLLPIHEEFCGEKLEPSFLYGIRSYNKGATLKNHTDRIETHHISSIIVVDKDLGGQKDWPLDFQDHNGVWHKIYAEPGDIILYESAKCLHGREETFEGQWYRNFYIHYKLKDWQFQQ